MEKTVTRGQQNSSDLDGQGKPAPTVWVKRNSLSAGARYTIIAAWGGILACIVFFGLTKIGF